MTQKKQTKRIDRARKMCMIIRDEEKHFKGNAPFHPVIIVTEQHNYEWYKGMTHEGNTCVNIPIDFYNYEDKRPVFNSLIKYKGYSINSNRVFDLFDGTNTTEFLKSDYLQECFDKAIWFSDQHPPEWFTPNYPPDEFTKDVIRSDYGDCYYTESQLEKYRNRKEKYDMPEWLKPQS